MAEKIPVYKKIGEYHYRLVEVHDTLPKFRKEAVGWYLARPKVKYVVEEVPSKLTKRGVIYLVYKKMKGGR